MISPLPFNLPPAEAIKFFREKGFRAGFSYLDVWQEAHATAFTVAKAMRLDVLEAINKSLEDTLASGQTFAFFKANLKPILAAKGWWGKVPIKDPVTGETMLVQAGSTRRLRTIFNVNMRTSYAAGSWERFQASAGTHPFLKYVAILDSRTRVAHRSWNGTVLPIGDKWWATHYPPNGWNCRCTTRQLSRRAIAREGLTVSGSPKVRTMAFRNKRTDVTTRVPEGIDPGFGYNVGAAHLRSITPSPLDGAPAVIPRGVGFRVLTGPDGKVPAASLPQPFETLPPLPIPEKGRARDLLPTHAELQGRGWGAERIDRFYAKTFLAEFGATIDKGAFFEDAIGETVPINAELLRDEAGAWKVDKHDRGKFMRVLAGTIQRPDEIWVQIERDKNRPGIVRIKRRYLKRWDIPGEAVGGISVFELGKDGWRSATTFPPNIRKRADIEKLRRAMDREIEKQRGGILFYKRPEPKTKK